MTGPALRDAEAAADCQCGCHPTSASHDLHDGGVTCNCQLTEDEREERRDEFLTKMGDLWSDPDYAAAIAEDEAQFAAAARKLGVSAEIASHGCPFVIVGNADGRGFYLRERHGMYRVTIAPDDDPCADPWRLPPESPTVDIAAGDDGDLTDSASRFDQSVALGVAVDAVRSHALRSRCDHRDSRHSGHRYCGLCGTRLSAA